MAIAPLPIVLPALSRFLLYTVVPLVAGVVYRNFDYGEQVGTLDTADPLEPGEWRHVQIVVEDSLSQDTADDMAMTLDIVNITNGHIDNSWTEQDHIDAGLAVHTWLQSISSLLCSRYRFRESKYYARSFNPSTIEKPWPDSGAPVFAYSHAVQCTGTGNTPPQISCTITEMTPSRGNWGRIYLPPPAETQFGATGRYTNAFVDTMVSQFNALATDLAANELYLTVPTTSVGGALVELPIEGQDDPAVGFVPRRVRTLQGVSGIRVDDTADTQRRRRYKTALYKNTVEAAPFP